MDFQTLHHPPVLVLGHGISGLSMARWCTRQGARVTLVDTRDQPERMAQLREQLPDAEVLACALDGELMARQPWAMVCKSPGLSPAQLALVTRWAADNGVPVVGELDLFAQALRQVYAEAGFAPKVLAITGTNGKTTTTSLTGQLLLRAGMRVAVAGNIGPAMLDVLAESAPDELPQVWVLELSSFQLDGVRVGAQGFEPTAATVLNITQDHLDWHGDMAHYTAAKSRVYGEQALMVLNREDPAVMAFQPAAPEAVKRSRAGGSADGTRPQPAPVRVWTTFGTDMPRRPGDWGLETVNGMTWLVRATPADETQQKKRGAQPEEEWVLQRLMPAEALRIRGRHNAANALAALALATAAGAALAPMLHGLREYRGEPHRVESVAVIDGVEYFDDSKGTNVGATLAAIKGLGAERRLVMILGGDGKGQDFSPLADAVRAHVQAVVLIGRDAPRLRDALEPTGVPVIDAATLPEAVQVASQHAREGQAVLMSPACASLDMFKHYGHRAEVFCDAVQAIANERGQA